VTRPLVYAIDGITPVVDPAAFVHPSAVLIGDVIVASGAYIGPAASLRGDFGRIVIEEGANVQDGCVMHGFPGKETVVGAGANIGHGAVLHGCMIGRGALIGMNCVVNDNAEVGEEAVIAALGFVKAEDRIPPRVLAAGVPARVKRALQEDEIRWMRENAELYRRLAVRSARTMRPVEPLAAAEPGRRRIEIPGAIPLSEMKAKQAKGAP
jgi:phenylacetic acid degradation protein